MKWFKRFPAGKQVVRQDPALASGFAASHSLQKHDQN
jgi:hypothetical protein